MRRSSIKNRITFLAVAATALALLVAMIFSSILAVILIRTQITHGLQTLAEVTAVNSQASILFNDKAAALETLNALSVRKGMVYAEVSTADGALFVRKDFNNEFQKESAANHNLNWINHTLIDTSITIERPILMDGRRLGTIRMVADLSPMWASILFSLGVYLCALLLAFFAALLLIRKMRNTIISPIQELGSAAQRIAQTRQYSLRVAKQTEDELGQLTDQFNFMLSEVEQRDRELLKHSERLEEEVQARTKEMEKALEMALSANRAKSEFLSNMSHELRTPLNAVIGFSQLMSEDTHILDPSHAEYVTEIHNAGAHLLRLIEDILDFSRIDSGNLDISLEPVQVAALVQESVSLLHAMADRYEVSIQASDIPASLNVRADRTRLKQVLVNLISNAVKYNRKGGTARVDVEPALIQGNLRINITDTGFGIPEQKWEELFRPFSRLGFENSGIEGTGIGLALSKRLMEAMDGEIGVESEENVGSTFWLSLPLAVLPQQSQGVSAGNEASVPLTHAIRKILYIEDNPSNRHLMEAMFKRYANIELVMAPDAEIGLALVEATHPDLILLDINLPGMDGYMALQKLRRAEHTRGIPVVAVSANASKSGIERGQQAGFSEYLTKPFTPDKLRDVINRHLPPD